MREPVYLRGNVWWCRVKNPNGGRCLQVSTGCKDRKAAIERWRQLEFQSVKHPDQTKDKTTLSQALDRRIAERRSIGRAAGTIECLTQKARQLTRVIGVDTALSAVTARTVDHYIQTRMADGASRSTVQKELSTLRGALKLARRQGYDVGHVDDLMPLEFAINYKPKKRALSEAETHLLLNELPPQRAAVVAFIVATSATYPSEVQNAIREDIDLKRWIVHLRGTKRDSRDRYVPVPKFARKWLKFALKYANKTGKLFQPWGNIRRRLHIAARHLSACHDHRGVGRLDACKACQKVPVFEPLSPNDLRRTWGRQLRARGVEPQLIAAGMGHKDSRMVERVYGRITPEELAGLLEARLG